MLTELIVLDVIETGSAPGAREWIHHQISSREEENSIEERQEEESTTTEGEEETIQR